MDVVGGPVVAAGDLIVIASEPNKTLWLEGIQSSSGLLVWRVQVTDSFITPGVPDSPAVANGIALALLPDPAGGAGAARLAGIATSTGTVAWSLPEVVGVDDVPVKCPGLGSAFCLPLQVTATTADLLAIDARSGRTLSVIPHVRRALGNGIYETDGSVETIEKIVLPRGVVWSTLVAEAFPGGDLNDGWIFEHADGMEIGSVSPAGSSRTVPIFGDEHTVGFSSTGRRLWSDPGAYSCGGSFNVIAPFLCSGTGTATATTSGASVSITTSRGATLDLKGVDPHSGHETWTFPAGNIAGVLQGKGVEIRDSSHILLSNRTGRQQVLDLSTGAATPPKAAETFWCQRAHIYLVAPLPGSSPQREGVPQYFSCNATGAPSNGSVPESGVAGVQTHGMFVWVGVSGLAALRARP